MHFRRFFKMFYLSFWPKMSNSLPILIIRKAIAISNYSRWVYLERQTRSCGESESLDFVLVCHWKFSQFAPNFDSTTNQYRFENPTNKELCFSSIRRSLIFLFCLLFVPQILTLIYMVILAIAEIKGKKQYFRN